MQTHRIETNENYKNKKNWKDIYILRQYENSQWGWEFDYKNEFLGAKTENVNPAYKQVLNLR